MPASVLAQRQELAPLFSVNGDYCDLTNSYSTITDNFEVWESFVASLTRNNSDTYDDVITSFGTFCDVYGVRDANGGEELYVILLQFMLNSGETMLDISNLDSKYSPLVNNDKISYVLEDVEHYDLWKDFAVYCSMGQSVDEEYLDLYYNSSRSVLFHDVISNL